MTPKSKKHKQRFEHDWDIAQENTLTQKLQKLQELGFELISVTQINDSEYTLFFKRSVWPTPPNQPRIGRAKED